MAGNNHPPSRDVKTTVTLVTGGITDEDTWRGARCKFVGSRGTKVRIIEAAEHVKLRIIRYGAMEELVRDLVADRRGRAPVQQEGCCSQCFSLVRRRHGSMDQQRSDGVVDRTKHTLGFAILWRGVGAG
jgi:hypothetical protein